MEKKILILKIGALGDVVRTTYLLPSIIKKYGNVKIYWITSKMAFDLLKYNKYIDNLIIIDDCIKIKEIENIEFDLILSLEDEEEIFSKIEKIKYKKLSGVFRKNSVMTYTDDLKEWFDMGLISKYGKEKADFLKKENRKSHAEIFAEGLEIEKLKPYFFNDIKTEEEVNNTFSFLEKEKLLIGLNLNAGKRWPSKSLRIEEGIKLIKLLLNDNKNNYILLLGGKEDLDYNQKIMENFKNFDRIKLIKPCNLNKFSAIIKNLDILICSDTLALHLAISQSVKTVSYYAPTSAVEIDVFNLGEKVISTSKDYCSYKPNVDTTTITAKRIYEKFKKFF